MRILDAITESGTYVHMAADGRKTLCGKRVYQTSGDTEYFEKLGSDEGDWLGSLYCARCSKSAEKLVDSCEELC